MLSPMKKWWIFLLFFLLLNPFLYLYNSKIIPQKINDTFAEFNQYSQGYDLSLQMFRLVSAADSYLLNGDPKLREKVDEIGIHVLKKEIDLLNSLPRERRQEINELIYLTEEYLSFITYEMSPRNELGWGSPAFQTTLDRHTALSDNLQKKLGQLYMTQDGKLKHELKRLIRMESSIDLLATVIIIVGVILLLIGSRYFLYPLVLRQSLMEEVVARSRETSLIVDAKGKIFEASPNAEKILGVPFWELKGKGIPEVIAERPLFQSLFHPVSRVIAEQKALIEQHEVIQFDDEQRFLLINYYPIASLTSFSGVLMLIKATEIKKDKQYFYEALESERKKISLEIHDWIGRNMSAIIHSLDYMLRSNSGNIPIPLQNELIRLRASCQTAVIDMRSIMYEIHPYLIDKVGLVPALQSYISTFEPMHNIKVNIFYPNTLPELGKSQEIVIYRIIQEALSNVGKHSSASEVDIYLNKEKDTLKVEILDNGKPDETFTAGKGMWGMKERAHSVGGDLTFYSDIGNGFGITLTIPMLGEGLPHGSN